MITGCRNSSSLRFAHIVVRVVWHLNGRWSESVNWTLDVISNPIAGIFLSHSWLLISPPGSHHLSLHTQICVCTRVRLWIPPRYNYYFLSRNTTFQMHGVTLNMLDFSDDPHTILWCLHARSMKWFGRDLSGVSPAERVLGTIENEAIYSKTSLSLCSWLSLPVIREYGSTL